jgi:hypothetical protein
VPTLFAFPSQQPIVLHPHFRALADGLAPDRLWGALVDQMLTLDAAERAALAEYDFVLFEAPQRFVLSSSNTLTPLVATPHFVLARLTPVSTSPSGKFPG